MAEAVVSPVRSQPPRRRGAKKLRAEAQREAEAPEEVLHVVDKKALCVEALMDGFVQSYVDLFYLTHRPDPNPDPASDDPDREIEVPVEEMLFLRDNLTQAESARRQGETRTVYACYNNLAQYFHNVKDPKTGIYFYEKCLEIARLTSDTVGEIAANHNLGLAHETINDVASAMRYHERHLELARSVLMDHEELTANQQLVKVYRAYAEQQEAQGEFRQAVVFHDKCLDAARAADDRVSEGLAGYRLGRAYVLLDEPDRAVAYLDEYLSICKELNDLEGQGGACSALAAAYQSLRQIDSAVLYLEEFLDIATKTDNLVGQGEACSNLGVIYNRRGQFVKAVQMFEKNFEISRSIVASGQGDRTIIDIARVNLGMARGNAQLGQYINVIQTDTLALLKWKNRRVKFDQAGR